MSSGQRPTTHFLILLFWGAEVGIKESGIIGIFNHSGKGPKRKGAETERGRKERGRKERGITSF
jgi:hypothetical protein